MEMKNSLQAKDSFIIGKRCIRQLNITDKKLLSDYEVTATFKQKINTLIKKKKIVFEAGVLL